MTLHVDEETIRWRERAQWWMLCGFGVILALGGSYGAVSAMFDNDTVCFGAGYGCITVDDSQQIWIGLVTTVIGVAIGVAAWRRTRD